jgi:hypothetical protein
MVLGLAGEVDLADYRAVFGVGGAHDPRTGRRLVGCLRPGLELVISPRKSVAELGVIGRADDMNEIVDAERDATLEYLDRLVSERGGRRGRAQTRVATGGLIWATSRHATTRAGDPQVHDHVPIANAVFMCDARGGWKGADTAFYGGWAHGRCRQGGRARIRDRRRSGPVRTPRWMGYRRHPGRGLRAALDALCSEVPVDGRRSVRTSPGGSGCVGRYPVEVKWGIMTVGVEPPQPGPISRRHRERS